MKKILFGGALIGAMIALTGCSDSLSPEEEKQAVDFGRAKVNKEREMLHNMKQHLQASDPNVLDVYMVLDHDGDQRIEIARKDFNGMIDVQILTKEDTMKILNAVENQSDQSTQQQQSPNATSGTTGMDMFAGAMMGTILGSAIGNSMFNGSRSATAHEERRRTQTNAYTTAATAAHTNNYRSAVRTGGKPSGVVSGIGRSTGGSFSSGARAGG